MLSRVYLALLALIAASCSMRAFAGEESDGGTPKRLTSLRWRVPSVPDRDEEKTVQELAEYMAGEERFFLPQFVPVVSDEWIFMRTLRRVMAVKESTGKRRWEYPWLEMGNVWKNSVSKARSGLEGMNSFFLEQRLWRDAVFADLTVGGGKVFALDKLRMHSLSRRTRVLTLIGPPALSANELVAFDIAKEGKLRWIVGGKTGGDDNKTGGMFFLGSGLYRDGKLLTLALKDGALLVVQLDADTGKHQWNLQITSLAASSPASQTTPLRLGGIRPLLIGKLLICPTSLNQVIAVDIDKQKIAWTFNDETPPRLSARHLEQYRLHWLDNSAFGAGENVVIVTPLDSAKVFGLDAATGEERWQAEAGEARLAAVHGETVLLLGRDAVSTRRASDGKPLWDGRTLRLPEDTRLSGRGTFDDDLYLLPTTGKQLLAVDVKAGKIVEQFETPSVFGNLQVRGDFLYSQNVESVEKFRWK
jgi:outer membrane protein assembly factor BamB